MSYGYINIITDKKKVADYSATFFLLYVGVDGSEDVSLLWLLRNGMILVFSWLNSDIKPRLQLSLGFTQALSQDLNDLLALLGH
ncbi:hypothetical protein BU005_12675 [Mammaliicoccus sciuri]|nr:hypothetical protein BU005_12675 [Mammaliicoccus sciuri]RIN96958.1 hypothetical protein BU002_02835 [Mammaliicoccus sciuri]